MVLIYLYFLVEVRLKYFCFPHFSQDSIGGSCHSVMITNIAPEERYYYDTYCTLNFASKSKKIVNSTVVRETIGK